MGTTEAGHWTVIVNHKHGRDLYTFDNLATIRKSIAVSFKRVPKAFQPLEVMMKPDHFEWHVQGERVIEATFVSHIGGIRHEPTHF